jgi:hypothetical protein
MMMKFCDVQKHADEGWGPHECSRIGHAFGRELFVVCMQYKLIDLLDSLIIYFGREQKYALTTMDLAFFGYARRNLVYLVGGERAPRERQLAAQQENLMQGVEVKRPDVRMRGVGNGPADMNVPQGMATLPGGEMVSRDEIMNSSFQQNHAASPQCAMSPARRGQPVRV